MLVDKPDICRQILRELLQVVEDLPKVFFNKREEFCELNIANSRDHEVCHRMVLVTYQQRELCLKAFHNVCATASCVFLLKFDTPVNEDSFD